MGTSRVGIREFRDKLSQAIRLNRMRRWLSPGMGIRLGITFLGVTQRSESEREALRQVAGQMQELLAAKGISEEDVLADYKEWRAGGRK